MPFDLSEVTFDADLGQRITVIRSKGNFGLGGWKETASLNINTFGIVAPSDSKSLQMIPEGDRITGSIVLITQMRLYPTHAKPVPSPNGTPGPGLSDKVIWHGSPYAVMSVLQFGDFGYNLAVLLREDGN